MCSLFGSRADRAAAGCRKMDVISCALLTELAEECVRPCVDVVRWVHVWDVWSGATEFTKVPLPDS